jgi:type IV pilus assembly protein PilW
MSERSSLQAGFTLIEMLIAMTLGLLLVIVIGQVFVTSKESYRTTEDLSRLQESARFAASQMSRIVRMAGFISDPLGNRATIFPAGALALDGANGAGSSSDEITVRYQGSGSPTADGTVFDCRGNPVAAVDPAVLHAVARYFVATGADGGPALFCDNTGTVGVTTGPIELASGVENLQILYGEDTDATPDGTTNRYVARADVANLDRVVSLRLAFLVRSANQVATAPDTRVYSLLGTSYDPVDERRLRRVYTATITLRNRAP